MKYQSEYQRSYQNRAPRKFHELSVEEQNLSTVPIRRASSSSPGRIRRRRSLPSSPVRYVPRDGDYALIGPNEKFSSSHLYRLKEPFKSYPRVPKSREYAILGRNEKFENNVIYPLRKPVESDSPRVIVRHRKHPSHTCGIQAELDPSAGRSFDSQHRRDAVPHRRPIDPQSEYKNQYIWKEPLSPCTNARASYTDCHACHQHQDPIKVSPMRRQARDAATSANALVHPEVDLNKHERPGNQVGCDSTKPFHVKHGHPKDNRTYHRLIVDRKHDKQRKAFEAEEAQEQRRKEILEAERAHSDDEEAARRIDLGHEFRQKCPHGRLRRWKSEYQSTYKPFWRFDYKDGKWYKDPATDERGFNPNLFWYKELVSTRQRANQYRVNAETDHFNPEHTLQVQGGAVSNPAYRAWDLDDECNEADSVISIDRDLERERLEGERRREKDAKRKNPERVKPRIYSDNHRCPKKPWMVKNDKTVQTECPAPEKVIYVDDPPPQQPGVATKAFVRNLGSSSILQHMSWDSQSLCSLATDSDVDSYKRPCTMDGLKHRATHPCRREHPRKESRGTGTHSPVSSERQPIIQNRCCSPPKPNQRPIPNDELQGLEARSTGTNPESHNATGRASYDPNLFDKRPSAYGNEYCSYPASRFKDEVTEYYYGRDDARHQYPYGSLSKPSFQNHVKKLDECYDQVHKPQKRDDDVLSVHSARSLSSMCSLASQTLERAQENMNKYWGDRSPKKPSRTQV